ncbi:MAG: DUF6573 family protein [Phycisphaeraceae bacterium]
MKTNEPKHEKQQTEQDAGNPFADAPVIYSYTRKQALEDGVLVDLTDWAKETGFRVPVACTRAVWDGYLQPPKGTEQLGQSVRGRSHDLLWMLYVAIRKAPGSSEYLSFEVIFLNRRKQQETITLKAICGPGDEAEPVMTVMLPNED